MTAESLKARMERGDKMLKLFESGLGIPALMERFRIRHKQSVSEILRQARMRREREQTE